MSIIRVAWAVEAERDIHVLAGQTTRSLRNSLFIFDTANPGGVLASTYLPAHATVSLAYNALFKGAPAAIGMHVDATTGAVTVDAALPPLFKRNFIIEATVTDSADHSTASVVIRVHVHKSVKSFALTPPSLTVRPQVVPVPGFELTSYRFAVRATFDDDTMGDLTTGHAVVWTTNVGANVNFDGRILLDATSTVGAAFNVVATLPAAFGGGSRNGAVTIAQPWSAEPTVPKAKIIPGGGWPGTTAPDRAPNILIMGDGFATADAGNLETMAASIVHFMKTDTIVRPYDLLCTSMNFWQLMVPAAQRGTSFRCEVYAIDATHVYPVPRPIKPPATGAWDIRHLVHRVGLPVPADMAKSVSDLRGDWVALVPVAPPAGSVSDDLVTAWKMIGKRGFIDEIDAFPAMSYGAPPAANIDTDSPMIDLHSDRIGRPAMASFFNAVKSDNGVMVGAGAALGSLWANAPQRQNNHAYALGDVISVSTNARRMFVCTTAGTSAAAEPAAYATAAYPDVVPDGAAAFTVRFAFDNTDLIVMMSAHPGGRAANYEGYIALSTQSGTFLINAAPVGGASNFTLNMPAPPADISVDVSRVVAHEIGHSFGLNDEYIDFEADYPFTAASLADYANVQSLDSVQDAAKNIDGKLVRWNWLRVRKAAVLTGPAVAGTGAGSFSIPVVLGQGLQFAANDLLLMRLRRPGVLIDTPAKVVELQTVLQVVSRTADAVVVGAAAGGAVTLADLQAFPAGSTLFKPVPMPSGMPGPTDPFARMMAKNVENLITSKHAALYLRPAPANLDDDMKANKEVQHPSLDGLTPSVPGRPFCFKVKPSIVGLYGGGSRYASKVFHPTGAACMMRNSHSDDSPFCPVCRYIMVEMIDPFQHFTIDIDYDDIYPLR